MKIKNIKSLEKLSLYCQLGGILAIFLGIFTIFTDLMNKDVRHIQVGLFLVAIGYALFKISTRITAVLTDENTNPTGAQANWTP